nr:hypothetical protein [Ursidibacter arcticus]
MWCNEQKNCPYCQNTVIHKHGLKNNIQRYKYPSCSKTFTFQKKLNYSDIWFDYSQGKQTYKELAIKYKCSVKTIQRYIDKAPKTALKTPISTHLNIIMDTTFFGREFGILVIMDSVSEKVVYYRHLHLWYLTHQDYLNERSDKCNEKGYFPYKHKGLRSALSSLKYYEKYLFTFEKYPELNIEKTTNRLEGLFSELKRKLNNHNGLSKKRKIMFIKGFFK